MEDIKIEQVTHTLLVKEGEEGGLKISILTEDEYRRDIILNVSEAKELIEGLKGYNPE
jgi:hypothetical protein